MKPLTSINTCVIKVKFSPPSRDSVAFSAEANKMPSLPQMYLGPPDP